MTDSPLAAALRECEEALAWLAAGLTTLIDSRSLDNLPPDREIVIRFLRQGENALSRAVELARQEGIYEGMDPALHYHDRCHDARLEAEAAARLAGRLEQAEWSADRCGNSRAHSEVWAALKDERDRLRAELEAAGKGEK